MRLIPATYTVAKSDQTTRASSGRWSSTTADLSWLLCRYVTVISLLNQFEPQWIAQRCLFWPLNWEKNLHANQKSFFPTQIAKLTASDPHTHRFGPVVVHSVRFFRLTCGHALACTWLRPGKPSCHHSTRYAWIALRRGSNKIWALIILLDYYYKRNTC